MGSVVSMDREAPEADVIEQEEEVLDTPDPERPHIGIDVPEADAIEQAEPVPYDEDDFRS